MAVAVLLGAWFFLGEILRFVDDLLHDHNAQLTLLDTVKTVVLSMVEGIGYLLAFCLVTSVSVALICFFAMLAACCFKLMMDFIDDWRNK